MKHILGLFVLLLVSTNLDAQGPVSIPGAGAIPSVTAITQGCGQKFSTTPLVATGTISGTGPCLGIGAGTAQAQTATYTPAITALTDGLWLAWTPSNANSGAAPTFAPDGLTAHPIVKANGSALVANDLITTAKAVAVYNLAQMQWELQNPQTPGAQFSSLGNFTSLTLSTAAEITTSPGVVTKVFSDGFVRTAYGADDGTHFSVCPSLACATTTDTIVSAIPGKMALTMFEGADGFAVIGLASADYSSVVIIHLLNLSGSSKNTNTLAISAEIGPLVMVKGANGFPQGVVGDIANNTIRTISCSNSDGSSCAVSTGISAGTAACSAVPDDFNGCYTLSAFLATDTFIRYAYIDAGAVTYVRNRDITGTLSPVSTVIVSATDQLNYNVQIASAGGQLVVAYLSDLGTNAFYLAVSTCTTDAAVSCTVASAPTWQLLKNTVGMAPASMTIGPSGFPMIVVGENSFPGLANGPYFVLACGSFDCPQSNVTITPLDFGGSGFSNTGSVSISVTTDGVLNIAALNSSRLATLYRGAAPYGAYAITSANIGGDVTISPVSSISATLPQAGTAGFNVGSQVTVVNSGSAPLTIIPATSTIFGLPSLALNGGASATIYSDGTNYVYPPAAQNYLKASLNFENADPSLFWWYAGLASGNAVSVAYFSSDSIVYGTSLSTPYTQNFTGVIKQRLLGKYANGGDGFQYFRQSLSGTIADGPCPLGSCSWASTGSWSRGPATYGIINPADGAQRTPLFAGASATATLSSAYFANIDIYYICTTDTGSGFTVNIDAGGATTYGALTCVTPTWKRQNVVSAIGTHSVVLTAPASGNAYFWGVSLNVGGANSIEWHNPAIPGTSAKSWCMNPNFTTNSGWLAVFPAPNLIVLDTVANDFSVTGSVTTFRTDLDTCLSNIKSIFPSTSLMVMSTHRYGSFSNSAFEVEDQYYTVQRQLAQKYQAAYINVADRWGSLQQELDAGLVFSVDDYHATIAGNQDYAAALLDRILPSSWGGVAPGGTTGQIQYNNDGVLGGLASTGTGNIVRVTNTTLVNPALGTIASGVMTNATGLPPGAVTSAQGNGTKFQFSTGTTTTNDYAKYDANGNTIDGGAIYGTFVHTLGSGSAPTCTPGTALNGGTCTFSADSTDLGGEITLVTGAIPTTGTLFTVTWTLAYTTNKPVCNWSPTNPSSAGLATTAMPFYDRTASSTSAATFTAGTLALGAVATLKFNYVCAGPK